MGKILLFSESEETKNKFDKLLAEKYFNYFVCASQYELPDLIEKERPDIYIIDAKISDCDIKQIIKDIKNSNENTQVLLYSDGKVEDNELFININGYIFKDFSDNMILCAINSALKTKSRFDKLVLRNTDMAESLYRLNVLYNTSSQFAGTLDTKKLLTYMIEGLDKSLSFDLACTISFGFENEPVLIVDSLYDISEELMNAIKLRAVLNYKGLFESKKIPFEIDDTNLKIVKNIKNPHEKFSFAVFQYDNIFAPIDLGDQFFGCIEIFKNKAFTSDDAAYFQTIVRQVSLPLKSAGLYKEIIQKNIKLERLESLKSNFTSIVSHELRTPLTPLNNALSILSNGMCGDLNENGIKFLNMAKRNVKNLTSIINDLLDFNKIEAGKMVFKYKPMNIHSVIENVKNNFDSVAKEHKIILSADEQLNLPEIFADSQRLEQILTNLISNAIKFTPENKHIVIKSELKNAKDIKPCKYFEEDMKTMEGNYVIVSVSDEGIGMKDENILKAFEMFSQIENPLTRKVGGTGLGLTIVKQLVKAHKGVIWCTSEENKGSTFYFAIPAGYEHAEGKTVQKELI